MANEEYRAYLDSPEWRAKRLEALAFYGRRCRKCGETRGVLHVHHLHYRNIFYEKMEDLTILCPPCHKEADRLRRNLQRVEEGAILDVHDYEDVTIYDDMPAYFGGGC